MDNNPQPANPNQGYEDFIKKTTGGNFFASNKKTILFAALGILIFLLIAVTFPFRDELLDRLFPKPPSKAFSTQPTIEQQINIMDQYWSYLSLSSEQQIAPSYLPQDNSLGIVKWDSTKYSGANVYFEVDMKPGCLYLQFRPLFAALFDISGNQVAGSEVQLACLNNAVQRIRSGPLILSEGYYTVRLKTSQWLIPVEHAIIAARLIVMQTDPFKITGTQTQIDLGNGEGTSNTNFTTMDRKKIYLYDETKFNPKPQAYFEATLRASKPKIEQQINILTHNFGIINKGADSIPTFAPTDNSLGLIHWDSAKYPGAKVYFETVAYADSLTTLGGTAFIDIALFDSLGNQVSGSEIRVRGSYFPRQRSGQLTLADGDYTVRIKPMAWGVPLTHGIIASRLIIVQEDAVKLTTTETQVEVGNSEGTSDPTNYQTLEHKKIYFYDETKFNPKPQAFFEASIRASKPKLEQQINILDQVFATTSITDAPTDSSLGLIHWDSAKYPGAKVYFEAVLEPPGITNEYAVASLYNLAGNQVPGSEVKVIAGQHNRERSGQLNLPSGDYTVRIRSSDYGIPLGSQILAARLIIVQEDPVRLTNTQTQIEAGNSEGTSANTYTTLDRKKIYFYDETKFNPKPQVFFEASLRASKPKIEQQINIIDQRYSIPNTKTSSTDPPDDTPTDNSLGIINFDAAKYQGAKVYFEAVITPPGTTNQFATATLYTTSGAPVSGTEVKVVAGQNHRVRSGPLTLTSGDYTVRAKKTVTTGTAFLDAARLIIVQEDPVKLTDTQTQIEVGNNETTLSITYVPPVDKKIYHYDSTKFTPQPSVYFEATLFNDTVGQTALAALYQDGACTNQVSGSEISVVGQSWTRVRSLSPITLTSGTDYTVCLKASGGTARLANAKIILDQSDPNGITDLELIHQQVNTGNTSSSPKIYQLFDLNNFGVYPTAYFETVAKVSSGTRSISLKRTYAYTSSDYITSLSLSNTAYERKRSENIIFDLPQTAEEIEQVIPSSATISSSQIILQLNNIPTNGGTGYARLFNQTDNVDVFGSEITTTSGGLSLVRVGPFNLATDKEYVVQTKSATLANAKIVLDQQDQSGITDVELIHHQVNTIQDDSYGVSYYNLFDLYNFGVYPKSFFEVDLKAASGTARVELFRPFSQGSVVTSYLPTLSTTATSYTRLRSPENIVYDLPQTAEDLHTLVPGSSISRPNRVSSSWLILQLNNIPTNGGRGYARLFNQTDNVAVTGSEVSASSSGFSLARSGSLALNTDKEYVVQTKSATMNGAKLILTSQDPNGITDLELIQHQVNTRYKSRVYNLNSLGTGNGIIRNYNLFDLANFGVYPKAFFEVTAKKEHAGGNYVWPVRKYGYLNLLRAQITTTDPNYIRIRPGEDIAYDLPQTFEDLNTEIAEDVTADPSIASSWLILQLNNIPTNGGMGYARLLNETDGLDVGGSEVATDSANFTLIRSQPFNLPTHKEYVVQTKSATLANAKIVLDQQDPAGLADTEVVHEYLNTGYRQILKNESGKLLGYLNESNPANFGPGPITYCHEATMKNEGGDYAKALLYDFDTTKNLTIDITGNVAGNLVKGLFTTSTSFSRQRRNVTTVIPDLADDLDTKFTDSKLTDTYARSTYFSWFNNSWLIIQASGLNSATPSSQLTPDDNCLLSVIPTSTPGPSPTNTPTPPPSKNPPCESFGDINLDGQITQADADLVLGYLADTVVLDAEQLKRADVDDNGVVTDADATLILQYLGIVSCSQ